jgi:2-aminobenzoate-CoA ligase
VRDCAVVGQPDTAAGEIPCAFVVLRDSNGENSRKAEELSDWVASRLTSYKQPRAVRFVAAVPRNPSGKILRRELRTIVESED